MNNDMFGFLVCPFCPNGGGDMQIDKAALRDFARRHHKRKKVEQLIEPSDEVLWFGYAPCRPEPCEHVCHMEAFISRGPLKAGGHLLREWGATFQFQHKSMLELDADGIARNCLFESIYLRTEPTDPPEFRPATPHVVTNWLDYRWHDEDRDGEAICVDVRVHAFLAENFRRFLADLCGFAESQ